MNDAESFSTELKRAAQHYEQKQPREAAGIYQSILDQQPDHYAANYSLGMLFHEIGRNDLAIPLLRKSTEIRPEIFAGFINLGMILRDEKLFADSRASLEKAVDIHPASAIAHVTLGLLYMDMGMLDQALEEIEHGLQLKPEDPMTHARMGMLRQVRGEIDAAEACFIKVLELIPQDLNAHRSLALLKKQTEHNDNTRWLEDAFSSADDAGQDRMLLGFTLGKVFDDLGNYDTAFGYLSAAHRIRRRYSHYSVERQIESFDRHRRALGPDLLAKYRARALDDETPVFVLGMPRSGTSLTEQILASHPLVHGAGEVEYMRIFSASVEQQTRRPFPDDIEEVPVTVLQTAARAYIERLRINAGQALRVVDKLPHNFLRVGLIGAVMPGAKIILCERDPLDNCLSIYQNLLGPAHPYASDLSELGHYYKLYRDLMDWWDEILPGHMYRVRYESMVADPEQQVRALLQHCGLEFHEDCLAFHKTRRQVKTPSEAQVRQPIYRSSVGRWKNYHQHLGPLIDALGGGTGE
jgi:tetratricopeptide (TPR) repeat protein